MCPYPGPAFWLFKVVHRPLQETLSIPLFHSFRAMIPAFQEDWPMPKHRGYEWFPLLAFPYNALFQWRSFGRNYRNYDSSGKILGGGSIHMQGGIWLNSEHLFIPQDLPQACPLLFWGPGLQQESSGNSHGKEPQETPVCGWGGRVGQWETTRVPPSPGAHSNLPVRSSSFKRWGMTNVIMQFEIL